MRTGTALTDEQYARPYLLKVKLRMTGNLTEIVTAHSHEQRELQILVIEWV